MGTEYDVVHLQVEPASPVEFKVDTPKRRIEGLLLPWNQTAMSNGDLWKFQKGSIQWSDVSRIKLLRDHDMSRPIGRAVSLTVKNDGLYGDFFIGRGPDGDRLLELAEDGIVDGFSVGPIIPSSGWEMDSSERGVRLVHNARLAEVTITAIPAFDDARATKVTAAMQINQPERKDMGEENKNDKGGDDKQTVVDGPDDAMVAFEASLTTKLEAISEKMGETFSAQQGKLVEAITGAFQESLTHIASEKSMEDGERAQARIRVTKEPPVYRFDGSGRDNPSLVRDYWRANTERDHDCLDRLHRFGQQQREMVTALAALPPLQRFAVTTSNAGDVIPPGYRPDLFVNELMQNRPIVAQGSRGTITDATPFTVPQFVSSSGATADHVEGTNPTGGTLTLDQTTVTPGAVSGKFELTREIVDSANPAIDAIALAAMRESYNQQTEAKAYTALNAVTPGFEATAVSIAALGDGSDNTISVARDMLARYPFIRFAAPTGAVMSQGVTRDFANAKDADGRQLLPSVGATNAVGVGNAVNQSWFVDGLAHVPAWAMTQGVGDDVLIILNRADVWYWESPMLTFRFEEKSGPALIELALFSYFAAHVLRPAGIFVVPAAA